jgi:hypothetical protein
MPFRQANRQAAADAKNRMVEKVCVGVSGGLAVN